MKLAAAVMSSLIVGAFVAFVTIVAYTTWAFVDSISD
jgi:hypothetical protein